ncbi:hypothetical protein C0993_012424 [Termitomyces sp. T159_Od127]|nr:hypothetical protein C0993_012424 [Termitomyces sp. T159_Od127]
MAAQLLPPTQRAYQPITEAVEEFVHSAQVTPMTKRLLRCLEAAGQPVLAAALFLQDNLAFVVIEELPNQIKLMKKQCVSALEQINCTSKHKVGGYKEPIIKVKRAQVQPLHTVFKLTRTEASVAEQPACLESVAVRPPPVQQLVVVLEPSIVQDVKNCPVLARLAPASISSSMLKDRELAQPVSALSQHCGCKLLLDVNKMEVFDFPANILACAEPVQMFFMLHISIPGPPAQYLMVVLVKDPCTPAQYNGLVATQQKETTASKGKMKAMPADNKSDYREESSKQEHVTEEDKMPREKMQQIV